MPKQKFKATLESRGGGTLVELPIDVPKVYGGKRVPIVATVNGHEFRSTIAVYGGKYYVGLNKQVREAAGVEAGDTFTMELDRDDAPRTVEVPDDLAKAFKGNKAARDVFDKLSYTHQKEYVRWITEAKKAETRERRAGRAIEMLVDGVKTPD